MKVICSIPAVVAGLTLAAIALETIADDARLPETTPLKWTESELPDRLMDGAHRFVERKIVDAAKDRHRFWPPADASAEVWKQAAQANRKRLTTIIGAVDERQAGLIDHNFDTVLLEHDIAVPDFIGIVDDIGKTIAPGFLDPDPQADAFAPCIEIGSDPLRRGFS